MTTAGAGTTGAGTVGPGTPAAAERAAPRLLVRFREEIVPKWVAEGRAKNPHAVPRLAKIVLNMGLGEAVGNPKVVETAANDLRKITGQAPRITRAKKSEAGFKLRKGMPIGLTVTLRGDRMYEFFDRLVNFALPRSRDFRGVPEKSFDGRGNYNLGIREQVIFPEIDFDEIDAVRGMDIAFVTTARTDEEARALLADLGMPFRKRTK